MARTQRKDIAKPISEILWETATQRTLAAAACWTWLGIVSFIFTIQACAKKGIYHA